MNAAVGALTSRMISYRTYDKNEFRDISSYLLANNYHKTNQFDFDDAQHQLGHWLMAVYNTQRIHSALDYHTPLNLRLWLWLRTCIRSYLNGYSVQFFARITLSNKYTMETVV